VPAREIALGSLRFRVVGILIHLKDVSTCSARQAYFVSHTI
jgi:hypothetical protein